MQHLTPKETQAFLQEHADAVLIDFRRGNLILSDRGP